MVYSRLSSQVRKSRQYLQTPSTFLRGLNFARNLPPATHPATGQASPGYLLNWFDAHTEGPGIWKFRHYFDIYERHLAKFRGQEVHILEIGVYSGGSLQMWKDFFGPKARVYGVDIEPACRHYEDDQTKIFIGDQADKEFWKDVLKQVPRLDVVVDDGGHEPEQQIPSIEALLPNMRPGGVYICEDLYGRSSPYLSFIDGLSRELHGMSVAEVRDDDPGVQPEMLGNFWASNFQRLVGSVHTYPFISVVELRDTAVERLTAPRHGTEWKPTASAPWGAPREEWS